MHARRLTALVSLGLVGAATVGLVATSGNESDSAADVPSIPAATSAPDTESPDTASPDAAPPDTAVLDTVSPDTASRNTAAPTTVDPNTPDLPDLGPHPEFLEVEQWLQTNATAFEDFDGKVLAVQFWTFGCSNCQATFPHMRDLHAKYAGDDFEVIGVHAPEFDYERDVDSIAAAAEENGLVWPIAVDNEKLNFRSWQDKRFWPRLFLIDADGNIRYDHIGGGAYDEIDAAVGALINEKNA